MWIGRWWELSFPGSTGELLELYILHLRFKNRSPETQYCAPYRADKFLRWLESPYVAPYKCYVIVDFVTELTFR